MNTFGLGFDLYLRLVNNIFKKDNFFEVKITNSTGKTINLSSVYAPEPGPARYTKFTVDESAGIMVLSFVIQIKDNGDVMSTGSCTVKYDDITEELSILDFHENTNKNISLELVNSYSSKHISIEINRSDN